MIILPNSMSKRKEPSVNPKFLLDRQYMNVKGVMLVKVSFFYETWDNMEKNKCMLHSELFVQQIGQDKQCFDCSEPLLWTRSSCPSLLSFATRQAGWDDVAIAFL